MSLRTLLIYQDQSRYKPESFPQMVMKGDGSKRHWWRVCEIRWGRVREANQPRAQGPTRDVMIMNCDFLLCGEVSGAVNYPIQLLVRPFAWKGKEGTADLSMQVTWTKIVWPARLDLDTKWYWAWNLMLNTPVKTQKEGIARLRVWVILWCDAKRSEGTKM